MEPEYTLIGGILRFGTMARVVREKLNCEVNVPEGEMVKNRVHVDVTGEIPLEQEVERPSDLGGTVHNWAEEDGSIWCVMLDPEGNEFCVMTPD